MVPQVCGGVGGGSLSGSLVQRSLADQNNILLRNDPLQIKTLVRLLMTAFSRNGRGAAAAAAAGGGGGGGGGNGLFAWQSADT